MRSDSDEESESDDARPVGAAAAVLCPRRLSLRRRSCWASLAVPTGHSRACPDTTSQAKSADAR